MKLEEMMEHYNLNDVDGLIPNEGLSQEEKDRILQMTLEKAGIRGAEQGQRKQRPYRSKRKLWTTAIACVVVLAMATVSFAAMALDKSFLEFFGIESQEQASQLENMGSLIDKQVTDGGTTLHVRQAIGDGNALNILFDLIGPEGTVLDQDYYAFGTALIDLPHSLSGAGYSFEQLKDENPGDNKLSYMLSYAAEKNLSGQEMRFRFTNLMVPKNAAEIDAVDALPPRTEPGTPGDAYDYNKLILSGNWELIFPLDYKDTSTVAKVNQPISLDGKECTVTSVRYSPISVTATLKGDALRAFDEGVAGTSSSFMEVLKKDGTVVPVNGSGTSTRLNQMTITSQFIEVIDPAEIAAITIGGETIQLH